MEETSGQVVNKQTGSKRERAIAAHAATHARRCSRPLVHPDAASGQRVALQEHAHGKLMSAARPCDLTSCALCVYATCVYTGQALHAGSTDADRSAPRYRWLWARAMRLLDWRCWRRLRERGRI